MRDYRKFCRPRTTKHPEVGDVEIKLNCGNVVYVKAKDYLNIKNYFKVLQVVGQSNNSSGNIKVLDKVLNKEIYVSPETYSENSDLLELVEIVGEKKDPFGQYEYVDLGLSSGTLWCTTNVGADSETAIGNYYKFGETTVYDGSDYNTSAYSEVYDPDVELPLEYDAANVIQGGGWHIPTKAQWDELINNTTHTYISDYNNTGVSVIKFEKTNDSSTFIIIPTTGSYTDGVYKHPEIAYYWTKTTNRFASVYYAILTEDSYFFTDWSTAFGHGHTVRAVCDSVDNQGLAQEGDIICHNTALNRNVIFSYEDWLELDNSWDLVGLYGITTYEEEDAANGDYVIMANSHTLIIKPEDYSKVSNHWEHFDTITDPRLIATFNVTDTSNPTSIMDSSAISLFDKIWIDDVEQQSVVSSYTFDTIGEHTVKYSLVDSTTIGTGIFYNKTNLISIVIPNTVTTINQVAFARCTNLTNITIGSGVTTIGQNIFDTCSSLESITCLATTAPTIESNTFQNVNTNGTLYVPTNSDYSTWMDTGDYYLGKYSWTKVEQ